MVVGVSGVARSGKDSFYLLLKDLLNSQHRCIRSAFADKLKEDISPLVSSKFDIDIYSCSNKQKEMVRPLMVSYGMLARSIDKDYWIKKITTKIKEEQKNPNTISIITDVRYANEQTFLRKTFKSFSAVHIERFGFKPINEEEAKNTPEVKQNSDYIIQWSSFEGNMEIGKPFVNGFINERLKIR